MYVVYFNVYISEEIEAAFPMHIVYAVTLSTAYNCLLFRISEEKAYYYFNDLS